MPDDLGRRLERALGEVAEAEPSVRERARRAALGALPAPAPHRRGLSGRILALTLAGALVGGGAVATVGGLVGGADRTTDPTPTASGRLVIPEDSSGVGVLADGRAWVAMRNGLRIEGMPATALELSPEARFAALGIGRALVVLAPDGRRAWTVRTAGPVRQIAWRPDGLEVAYVVARGRTRELRVIEGDGDNDRRLATIAPVRPYWSADSLGIGVVTPARRRLMIEAVSGRALPSWHAAAPAPPALLSERRDGSLLVHAPTPTGLQRVATLSGLSTRGPVRLVRR